MSDKELEATGEEEVVDLDDKIGQAVTSALQAQREAEQAEREEMAKAQAEAEEALENARAEAAAEREAELRERFGVDPDADLDEWIAEQEREREKQLRRPSAPPGSGEGDDGPRIEVGSRFDRLDTFDLALRYETLKAFGHAPSREFLAALEDRAQQITEEEDILYYRHGEPVKAPAVDWDFVRPQQLERSELDEDPRSLGADKARDVLTSEGYDQLKNIAKADELIYSTQSSAGDEWVPTLMNAQLWRTVRLNAAVLGLFEQFDMPSQPYEYPEESTDPTIYKVSEATDQSQMTGSAPSFVDSTVGTAKTTFSAGKMGALSYWSDEMVEDSIVAFEPQIRDQYGIALAHGIDEILISGDETTTTKNISSYGSSIAASSRYLVIDGLRHEALVTTTADGRDAGVLTIDDFGATLALMGAAGKFGVNPNDLAFVMDPGVFNKARLLGEVLTLDKMGSAATIMNGQLGSLLGIPIIVSEDYDLTDATGHIDGTSGDNTLGSFFAVNRRLVKVGWRRRPRVRVATLPFSDAAYITGSARFDIGFKEAGAVGLSYNITV